VVDHAQELIDKHANEYLDSEEAAQKREKEGLNSALDKHRELEEKAAKSKEKKGKKERIESDFDEDGGEGGGGGGDDDDEEEEMQNPAAGGEASDI